MIGLTCPPLLACSLAITGKYNNLDTRNLVLHPCPQLAGEFRVIISTRTRLPYSCPWYEILLRLGISPLGG
jgi:hypothetical protein